MLTTKCVVLLTPDYHVLTIRHMCERRHVKNGYYIYSLTLRQLSHCVGDVKKAQVDGLWAFLSMTRARDGMQWMSCDWLLLSRALLMRWDQHHGYYQESSVLTTCLNFVIETFRTSWLVAPFVIYPLVSTQDWALIGVLHSARVDILSLPPITWTALNIIITSRSLQVALHAVDGQVGIIIVVGNKPILTHELAGKAGRPLWASCPSFLAEMMRETCIWTSSDSEWAPRLMIMLRLM